MNYLAMLGITVDEDVDAPKRPIKSVSPASTRSGSKHYSYHDSSIEALKFLTEPMSLKEWSSKSGIKYHTLWRYAHYLKDLSKVRVSRVGTTKAVWSPVS